MTELSAIGSLYEWIPESIVLVSWLIAHLAAVLKVDTEWVFEVTFKAKNLVIEVPRIRKLFSLYIVALKSRTFILVKLWLISHV